MLGSPSWSIVLRHMLPGILAPLAVIGTYVAANAMLLEATLSFLGCGLPPDIPTWGNIMADGRILFRIAPWIILFPGLILAIAVLAINLLGDGLRDHFDPATDASSKMSATPTMSDKPVLGNQGRLSVALPPGADRPLAVEGVNLKLYPRETLCIVGEFGFGQVGHCLCHHGPACQSAQARRRRDLVR